LSLGGVGEGKTAREEAKKEGLSRSNFWLARLSAFGYLLHLSSLLRVLGCMPASGKKAGRIKREGKGR